MTRLTFSDLLNSDFSALFGNEITVEQILICLTITFIASLFIYFVYKRTYVGVLYSTEFNMTLIVLSLITAAIMMGISTNIAISLGMVGALSIVRFRNAIKDSRDLAFLFWAISVGIINGAQFYTLSIISTLFIGAVFYIFSKRSFLVQPYVLVLKYSAMDDAKLGEILGRHCSTARLRNTSISHEGNEKVYELVVKKNKENALLHDLKDIKDVKSINLFSHKGELSE